MTNQSNAQIIRERSSQRTPSSFFKHRLSVVAVLLLLCAAIGLFFIERHNSLNNERSNVLDYSGLLTIDPKSRDFGAIWSTDRFSWPIVLRNESDTDIVVDDFRTSCNCTSIEPRRILIPAGQHASIKAVLDFRGSGAIEEADASFNEDFQVEVTPIIAGCTCHHEGWSLSGVVRHSAIGVPSQITLDDYPIDVGSVPSYTVNFKINPRCEDVNALCDTGQILANISPVEGSNEYQLSVSPIEQLPYGDFESSLRIVAVSKTGNDCRRKPFPSEAQLFRSFEWNRPDCNWG